MTGSPILLSFQRLSSPRAFFAMAPSSPTQKQASLDTFIKGKGKPSGAGSAKEMDSNGASRSNGGKRPRPDGTDVPPSAKKSKADGTHRAFPANKPEPSETTLEDNETLLEKFEEAASKAKSIKVGFCELPAQSPVLHGL